MVWLERLEQIFFELKKASYYWEPITPDQRLKYLTNSQELRPSTRYFGLGQECSFNELIDDGLNKAFVEELPSKFIFEISYTESNGFLVYDFWPPKVEESEGYVHLGPESFYLVEEIRKNLKQFEQKSVLDLGCSSGVIAFTASDYAHKTIGLDISARAIEFAKALQKEKKIKNKIECSLETIGSTETEKNFPKNLKYDFFLFNPPLAVPSGEDHRPHRDGGKLGIEIPLLFLDFAIERAHKETQIWFIAGSPNCSGKKPLYEAIQKRKCKILEEKMIHKNFNQALARKHHYKEQGIDSIDLVQFKLSL